ncbi:MAG: excisionase family DNA-binding protein [Planctomycetota bacterium]|nr:excisionase family DNA-binding protein [Planctomycetota bacterium]
MNQMISVKDASSYLGVSASTFKRLCERYAIPLHRTTGGHRRIDRADLDQAYRFFWNSSRKKCVSVDASDPDGIRQIVKHLLDRNIDTVIETIWERLETEDQLSQVLENTLIPALWNIGELWRTQEMDVYQEHICSNTVCTVLDLLLCRLPKVESTASLAIGGTFESNLDSIASKVACLVLRSIGMSSVDLGCNLPATSIAKAASDLQPSIVWICHTHVENPESIVENHRILRQSLASSVRVIIGGGGLSPALRRSLYHCTYFESMTMMVDALKAEPIEAS